MAVPRHGHPPIRCADDVPLKQLGERAQRERGLGLERQRHHPRGAAIEEFAASRVPHRPFAAVGQPQTEHDAGESGLARRRASDHVPYNLILHDHTATPQ